MIDHGITEGQRRTKHLGSESVHGLPLDWSQPKRHSRNELNSLERSRRLLATQNVHGIPTSWDELNLSE
jgi:hypothetical protein